MKELMTSIKDVKMEQDRIQALECCYKGWDDSIDTDTILDGIKARYRAFNNPIVGVTLSIRRLNLKSVDIIQTLGDQTAILLEFKIVDGDTIRGGAYVSIFRIPDTRACLYAKVNDIDYFHESELEEMGSWLLANFYHQ